MRAAAIGHGEREHHNPDVAELLELLAPRERKSQDEAVEDLQAADDGEGQKDQKQAVFNRAIDRTKKPGHGTAPAVWPAATSPPALIPSSRYFVSRMILSKSSAPTVLAS